ncbi:MAG: hypothetical protein JWL63_2941 [Rhodocyclales bacterium]|nr:hypothetical protein [Rhodocyclales bacterium]
MLASMSGGAGAAGLGRINVFSSLGQPLRAEVEIAATPDELEAMSAKVATPEAHARANIEYAGELTAVRMSIERRASGGAVVRISSDRAFNEPFVDMLVELNWGGGRILREYTFLLDPAESAATKPVPQITEPAVRSQTAPAAQPSAPAPVRPRASETVPAPRASRNSRPALVEKTTEAPATKAAAEKSGDYTVRQGDSASSIAAHIKPVEVTRDQMMAALYQNNQSAFGGGNINRLRTGQVLKIPAAEDVAKIDKAEARQIIVKASSFDALKQEVGAAVAKGPAKEANASQGGSGKVAPKVEEKGAGTAQTKDQLKISKTPGDKAGAGDGGKAAGRIQALEEDVASRDKALKEAKSRTAELERNVKELEKLVQMKSQNLADLQKQAAAAEAQAKLAGKGETKQSKAAAAAAEKAAALEKAKADKAAAATAAAEKAAAEKAAAAAKVAADKAAAEQAAKDKAAAEQAAKDKAAAEAAAALAQSEAAAAASSAAAAAAAASAPVVEIASAPVAPVQQSAAPAIASAPAVVPPVVEEESGILTNPLILGVIALALAGAGYVVVRNRRRNNANNGLTSLSEVSTSPNSVFGNAGGQTVDTGTSVLHTDFSQSGLSAIDTDEGVDPVAEADVYMAYGRDAQAEEILLDALKNDPSRIAIYLKLLEIYAQRRSVKQFENIATDLFTQTGGVGDDWAKAAALGARLDPGNPLYGGGNTTVIIPPEASSAVAAQPVAPVVPAVPVVPEPAPAEPAGVSFGTNNVSQMRATWTVPGEIGQFTGSGDGPVMAPEAPEEMVTTSPEPLNLDFNLDLELPEGDEPETQIEPRDEYDDLPLVMDSAPAPAAPSSSPSSAPLEFDLDMGPLSESDPVGVSTEPQHFAAEAAVDNAMQVLSETDSEMGIERSLERSSLSVVDLEKTNFESSLLDFDFELGEDTNVSRSNMDMSDVSLQTDPGFNHHGAAPSPSSSSSRQQAEFVDTSAASQPAVGTIDIHDEVSTKLELARAYEEMGDIEGARELLEEVMSDGAEQQKQMAQTILTRIA